MARPPKAPPSWLVFPALALAGWLALTNPNGAVVRVPFEEVEDNNGVRGGGRFIGSKGKRAGGSPPPPPPPPLLLLLEEALAKVTELEEKLGELAERMEERLGGPADDNSPSTSSNNTGSSNGSTDDAHYPAYLPLLPTCDDLMRQQPDSPFADGEFLARHTTRVRWVPRRDGSRQLELAELCRLKRYTANEANACLASKHVSMIGDSLTRYQHMSLAHLLEHGHYPPRFARPASATEPCRHVDEHGNATCAPFDKPNMCVESDWNGWDNYYEALCGSTDGGLLNGHMECHSVRIKGSRKLEWNDNMLYVNGASRAALSFVFETGFGDSHEAPIHGFHFTNCSYEGTCRRSRADSERIRKRTLSGDFDWRQPFPEAIGRNGSLRAALPAVDYALYNRGIWGKLSEDRAKRVFPVLHDWVSSSNNNNKEKKKGRTVGRCFFKSTTGHAKSMQGDYFRDELHHIRPHVLQSGCTYLDHAYLTESFGALLEADGALRNPMAERRSVFVDPVRSHQTRGCSC
jgi:hypothetical protein